MTCRNDLQKWPVCSWFIKCILHYLHHVKLCKIYLILSETFLNVYLLCSCARKLTVRHEGPTTPSSELEGITEGDEDSDVSSLTHKEKVSFATFILLRVRLLISSYIANFHLKKACRQYFQGKAVEIHINCPQNFWRGIYLKVLRYMILDKFFLCVLYILFLSLIFIICGRLFLLYVYFYSRIAACPSHFGLILFHKPIINRNSILTIGWSHVPHKMFKLYIYILNITRYMIIKTILET